MHNVCPRHYDTVDDPTVCKQRNILMGETDADRIIRKPDLLVPYISMSRS